MANTAVIRISEDLAEIINQYRNANHFSSSGDALLAMLHELRQWCHEAGMFHGVAHFVGGRDLASKQAKSKLASYPEFATRANTFLAGERPLLEQFLHPSVGSSW